MVLIDSGHGGSDPGKIGIHQEKEKDINLQIAKRLKKQLEKNGVKVYMTRENDVDLSERQIINKKVQDLKKRVSIMVFIMFFRERLLQVLEKARTISVLKN